MSYALMLFEELFASQLSVPSSPVHPIKCTTIQMKETEMSDKTETKEGKKTKIMTNSGNTERREIIRKKKEIQKRDMYSIKQNTTSKE